MPLRSRQLTPFVVGLAVSIAAGTARATVIAKVDGVILRSLASSHLVVIGDDSVASPIVYNVVAGDLNTRPRNPDTDRWVAVTFTVAPGVRGEAVCMGLHFVAPVAGAFDSGEWEGTNCHVRITRNVKQRYRLPSSGTVTVSQKLAGTFSGTMPHRDGTPGTGDVTISGRFRTHVFIISSPVGPE